MHDPFQLNRFIKAQEYNFERALMEIKNGRKTSHWMWYIFPQVKGLGKTFFSEYYSIKSSIEAKSYLKHDTLGPRLISATEALLNHKHKSAKEIFGLTDYLKLKSSLTLFQCISEEKKPFETALVYFFRGTKCAFTVDFLKRDLEQIP